MTTENKKVMKTEEGSEKVDKGRFKGGRNEWREISLILVKGCVSVKYVCCDCA